MMQSSLQSGLHVAIIMDGNGRWAQARGLPRIAGHRAGADSVRRVTEAAPDLSIRVLTLYAFSSDNWRRPPEEVTALMELLGSYLAAETQTCIENGVRLRVIGRRDRIPPGLRDAIVIAERNTACGRALDLRLAVDYSSREAIVQAAARADPTREAFSAALGPEVDLLIRTGGEQRLSDFLLWECAYAEFAFTRKMWPEFTGEDLALAVEEFQSRDRRFGGVHA
jgi:undecaprenyl diphosphate synthase